MAERALLRWFSPQRSVSGEDSPSRTSAELTFVTRNRSGERRACTRRPGPLTIIASEGWPTSWARSVGQQHPDAKLEFRPVLGRLADSQSWCTTVMTDPTIAVIGQACHILDSPCLPPPDRLGQWVEGTDPMSVSKVDGVIAALRVLAAERDSRWRKAREFNRLIAQLPGSRFGRLRHLRLRGDFEGEVPADRFLSQVKSTLAYLEANRDAIEATRPWSWWPSSQLKPQGPPDGQKLQEISPIDADFKEIMPESATIAKRKKGVRLIK